MARNRKTKAQKRNAAQRRQLALERAHAAPTTDTTAAQEGQVSTPVKAKTVNRSPEEVAKEKKQRAYLKRDLTKTATITIGMLALLVILSLTQGQWLTFLPF